MPPSVLSVEDCVVALCGERGVFFFRAVRRYSGLFSSDLTLKSSLVEQTYRLFFRHRALLRDGLVLIRNSLRSNKRQHNSWSRPRRQP